LFLREAKDAKSKYESVLVIMFALSIK
jgi:hypothetical protein